MSDATHDDHAPSHAPDEAGSVHGHEEHGGHDEHGRAESLGPIDWPAWGAGILGLGAGLVVALCLFVATSL